MFMKLSQRSSAWWVCVVITCVFSASLLTVLIYPVYADDHLAVCSRDNCGAPRPCGPCNAAGDGLGADGWYAVEAEALDSTYWTEGGGDQIQCWGQANTYHRANVYNLSGSSRTIELTYQALFREPGGGVVGCTPGHEITGNNNPPPAIGIYTVDDKVHFTNTYTQAQTYILGKPQSGCTYEVQALSELYFRSTARTADAQDPGPSFEACP